MAEMFKSSHVDILGREMIWAGTDFIPELKIRTVNHGCLTKLENLSLMFLEMVTKYSSDLYMAM